MTPRELEILHPQLRYGGVSAQAVAGRQDFDPPCPAPNVSVYRKDPSVSSLTGSCPWRARYAGDHGRLDHQFAPSKWSVWWSNGRNPGTHHLGVPNLSSPHWWSMADSNRRPLACQARAAASFRVQCGILVIAPDPLCAALVRRVSVSLSAFFECPRQADRCGYTQRGACRRARAQPAFGR